MTGVADGRIRRRIRSRPRSVSMTCASRLAYEDDNPLAILFSTMHEAGHAMYEQGSNPAYERTPLSGGTSLAGHESQSRMWEYLVGRSLLFWEYFYPISRRLSLRNWMA